LPFDNTSGYVTSVAVFNPETSASIVTLDIRDVNGVRQARTTFSLPGRGHRAFRLIDIAPASRNMRGVAEFSTTMLTLGALGLRFNDGGGGAFTSFPGFSDADFQNANGRQIISQLADGDTWKTTIAIVNADLDQAPISLRFFGGNGRDLPLDLVTLGQTPAVFGSFPGLGSTQLATTGTSRSLSQGWSELRTSKNLSGFAVFRQKNEGRPEFEATSPLVMNPTNRFLLPFDNTEGYVTSIALVNAAEERAAITVRARDENGLEIASQTVALDGRGHTAFELPTLVPNTRNLRGVLEFSSPGGISGLGLRFKPGFAFTSIPILTQ
jgi:hypothetical protein